MGKFELAPANKAQARHADNRVCRPSPTTSQRRRRTRSPDRIQRTCSRKPSASRSLRASRRTPWSRTKRNALRAARIPIFNRRLTSSNVDPISFHSQVSRPHGQAVRATPKLRCRWPNCQPNLSRCRHSLLCKRGKIGSAVPTRCGRARCGAIRSAMVARRAPPESAFEFDRHRYDKQRT